MDLILSLIPGGTLTAIAAAVLAALAGLFGVFRAGAKSERNKARAKDADAYEQHLKDIAGAHDARNRIDPDSLPADDPHRRD